MKKQRFAFLIALLFILSPLMNSAAAQHAYVDGEIIVRYKTGVSEAGVARSLSARNAGRLGGVQRLNIQHVRLPASQSVEDALAEYRRDPQVLYAEPNYRVHALVVPTDTYFSQQWGLQNTGQTVGVAPPNTASGSAGADIVAPLAWNDQRGSSGTVIAVLDTGMDLDHEDLVGQFWENTGETASNRVDDDGNGFVDDVNGWDFVNDDNNPDDDSTSSHGTHIGGIIGANGNNSLGVAGINWSVSLMVLKVLDANGIGGLADIVSAIDYAVANGAKVINASFAILSEEEPDSPLFAQSLYDVIQDAGESGVLVVAAAGNFGQTGGVEYPARFNLDNIISVTATGLSDELTDFGGSEPAAVDVEDVDLGAPGYLIYSTVREGQGAANNVDINRNYDWDSGTSFATAFVSGVAGLLLSEQPALSPDRIKARILNSVNKGPTIGADIKTDTVSGGRLDANRAIQDQIAIGPPTTASGRIPVIVPFGTALNVGETRTFTLDGNLTASGWSTSNPGVGTIAQTGLNTALFTAVGSGECTVSCTGTQPYTSATIYVRDVAVTGSDFVLLRDEESLFTASGGTPPYTWTSSNPSVISVELFDEDTAVVTAAGGGTATLKASDARGFFGTSRSIQVRGADTGSGDGDGKNCFIATAAFGSPMARHVQTLRTFRDRYLLTNAPGRVFVNFYYRHSPPLADQIAESPLLGAVVRALLMPLVLFASLLIKTGAPWEAVVAISLSALGGAILLYRNRRVRRQAA